VAMADADIQCELSYAYLHSVASRLGVECEKAQRVSDNHAVDARLHVLQKLNADYGLSRFSVEVQLKSASRVLTDDGTRFSYLLPLHQYDHLRAIDANAPLILVLLILPQDAEKWISQDDESLVSRKCAYWTSLYGAPIVTVEKPTVYVPKANILGVEALRSLLGKFSRREEVKYDV
jgi:hypothetical protein